MTRFLLALCSLLLVPCRATELTDLGQGLGYLRVHSVADSEVALRKVVPGAEALVLDLRYATTDDNSASALKNALAGRSANSRLFVLVSPATPATLAPVLAAAAALTLGAPGSVPAPRVVVQTDAAMDRRAFDALEAGTELAKLITGKIEKERFDEATLVQEFKNGGHAVPPPPADPTAPKTETPPAGQSVDKPETAAAPIDRVLQRAVHLHRALLALRRRAP